jgi:pimeloyl-ACP methyl ester carboxylesterase
MTRAWSRVWKRIRQVWITVGISATLVFVTWSLIAFRAGAEAHQALRSDPVVVVTSEAGVWRFMPASSTSTSSRRTGLVFFPGFLVDPIAYAPLARAVAEAGFPVYLVTLPRRGAFGGAKDPELASRVNRLMQQTDIASHWVLAGHSLGAVVACDFAARSLPRFAGLIGTTHPRDVSLDALAVPVTKIIGTHDGLATLAEVEENKSKLPISTNWVRIEGGNHSQFGWYGFQPLDYRATISAASQRRQMLDAVIAMLRKIAEASSLSD